MEVAIEEDDNGRRGGSRDEKVKATLTAEANIVRAFLPFLWLQKVFGSSKISIREGIAVSKSPLSRCYSALHTVLCIYSAYGFYCSNDRDYNYGLHLTFMIYMLLMSFLFGCVCVCKHRSNLDLFKLFAKFDVRTELVEMEDYELCLNEKVHIIIVFFFLTVTLTTIMLYSRFNGEIYLVYYIINKNAEFNVDLHLLKCCCMVELAIQRVGMLQTGLEQSLGQTEVMEQTEGGWLQLLLSWLRPQPRSLRCQVSLDDLFSAYVIIRKIVRSINKSIKLTILLNVVMMLLPACTITFIAEADEIEGKDPLVAVLDFASFFLKEMFIYVLLCAACERLALQESSLVCFLSEVSTDSSHLNPAVRSRARRIMRAMTSSPLRVSLWAGCDVRAGFIPVLLGLLTNCLLLRLQFS